MNRYLSFTLFTGLSLLTTIPIEAYTLNPNKTATSILQTNVIEVRSITSVQPIVIYCPVGTVPQLPYQVWVTYSDGQGEYRQTKWSNSALSTEQSEADDKVYPWRRCSRFPWGTFPAFRRKSVISNSSRSHRNRSEEHTSELQSH